MITYSDIGPDLDYEQFWSINSKKLQTSLVWYTPGDQQREKIGCGETDIPALYVTFDVKNTFSEDKEITYMSQLQWVHQDKWYIASYATTNQKDREDSKKRLKEIGCVE